MLRRSGACWPGLRRSDGPQPVCTPRMHLGLRHQRIGLHLPRASGKDVVPAAGLALPSPSPSPAGVAPHPTHNTSTASAASVPVAHGVVDDEEEYTTVYETVTVTEEEEVVGKAQQHSHAQPARNKTQPAAAATKMAAPASQALTPGPAAHRDQAVQPQATSSSPAPAQAAITAAAPHERSHTSRPATTVSVVQSTAPPTTTTTTTTTSLWQGDLGGLVMAASIMVAIRFSREQVDMERMDFGALQARQQESRVQSRELREKRQAFLEAERRRKEEEAARRMQELAKQAEETAKEKAAKEVAYREQQAKETARVKAQQDAARKAFQEQDALMQGELSRRTEVEMRLREEAERKKREDAERARQEEAERVKREQEAARARAEAERKRREEEAARRDEERRQLSRLQTSFSVICSGSVAVQQAAVGSITTGRLQQPARVQVDVTLNPVEIRVAAPELGLPGSRGESTESSSGAGSASPAEAKGEAAVMTVSASSSSSAAGASSSGGSGGARAKGQAWVQEARYESVDAALDNGPELSASVSSRVAQEVAQALKARAAAAAAAAPGTHGSDAFALMDPHEVNYWCRLMMIQVDARVRQAEQQVVPLVGGSQLEQKVKAESHHWVLPRGHPMRMDARLMAAAGLVAAEQLDAAVGVINRVIEDQEYALGIAQQGGNSGGEVLNFFDVGTSASLLPPAIIPSLVYAQLLDRASGAAGASAPPAIAHPSAHPSTSTSGSNGSRSSSSEGTTASGSGAAAPLGTIADTSSDARSSSSSSKVGNGSSSNGDAGTSGSGSSVSDPVSWPSTTSGAAAVSTGVDDVDSLFDSSATGLAALARHQLEQRTKALPEDALIPTARALRDTLGPLHPVTRCISQLADRHTSAATRRAIEQRRQREEAALAAQEARRLSGATAAAASLDPSSQEARKSLVPVPERLWALRNVANNLVRFGLPAQLPEAVAMLSQADGVARGHYGAVHPARLSTLLDLCDALGAVLLQTEAGSADAVAYTSQLVAAAEDGLRIVQAVAERYAAQQDTLSAVLLLESAVREWQSLLPATQPDLVAAKAKAEELVSRLEPLDMRVVVSKRNSGGVLRAVAKEFTEELAAYVLSRRNSKLQLWNKQQPLSPIR